ncbi:hypothetical protein ANCCAN_12137 [Ancylostoma caninum]|uniref:Uncharacterized protein n=1 Tax=Ancylostoma caninum TaxID=29170 RepID=A0A368GC05_ANCCA|nr:hypothetical protein ANCCAN_12137 [Ancylostoma caninum]
MTSLQGSRTRVLHQSRFQHAHSDSKLMKDKPLPQLNLVENIDEDICERILKIDFNSSEYDVLEQIQMDGKADQIWATARRNPSHVAMNKYIADFKNLQV